jgi:23S rRNA (guanosine2251-2'-O)-methyltransferase
MKEPATQFQIIQCLRSECRFRFPMTLNASPGSSPELYCPKCGALTEPSGPAYANYKEKTMVEKTSTTFSPPPAGPAVEALLDNIRSTYNVGAMFRTADGAGLRHLHLSGVTPTPGNPKINKTALGAEGVVPWSYHLNSLDAALILKSNGMRLWALESSSLADSLFTVMPELPGPPILLVVGNEISGVDPSLLEVCDKVLAIPMLGHKRSLNVAIAFGIAAYLLRFGL